MLSEEEKKNLLTGNQIWWRGIDRLRIRMDM